jgi:hypothetical protein
MSSFLLSSARGPVIDFVGFAGVLGWSVASSEVGGW